MTIVPPEKSMPSGTPRWAIRPKPARMMTSDRRDRVPAPADEVVMGVREDAHKSLDAEPQMLSVCCAVAVD